MDSGSPQDRGAAAGAARSPRGSLNAPRPPPASVCPHRRTRGGPAPLHTRSRHAGGLGKHAPDPPPRPPCSCWPGLPGVPVLRRPHRRPHCRPHWGHSPRAAACPPLAREAAPAWPATGSRGPTLVLTRTASAGPWLRAFGNPPAGASSQGPLAGPLYGVTVLACHGHRQHCLGKDAASAGPELSPRVTICSPYAGSPVPGSGLAGAHGSCRGTQNTLTQLGRGGPPSECSWNRSRLPPPLEIWGEITSVPRRGIALAARPSLRAAIIRSYQF